MSIDIFYLFLILYCLIPGFVTFFKQGSILKKIAFGVLTSLVQAGLVILLFMLTAANTPKGGEGNMGLAIGFSLILLTGSIAVSLVGIIIAVIGSYLKEKVSVKIHPWVGTIIGLIFIIVPVVFLLGLPTKRSARIAGVDDPVTVCGVGFAVPKDFTYKLNGETLTWMIATQKYQSPETFYILENNQSLVSSLSLSFEAERNVQNRFAGMEIHCVDNATNLTLNDYKSLVLANKNYMAIAGDETALGELSVIPITLSKIETQKEFFPLISKITRVAYAKLTTNELSQSKSSYIGLSEKGAKLFFITFSPADPSYPFAQKVNSDLAKIQKSLR